MGVLKRRDNQWFYRKFVRLNDGRSVRIFGVPSTWGLPNTKAGATAACNRHTAETLTTGKREAKPKPTAETPGGVTVNEFAPKFIAVSETSNKASSVDSKKQILTGHILPALGDVLLRDVTYAVIEDFKLALLKPTEEKPAGLSYKTVNNILTVLRRLLAVAAKRQLISAVPEIEWLRAAPQDFDFFKFDEADRLIEAAGDWRTMILLALRTGLRQGELLGLRWDDVDLVAGRIMVRQSIVRGRVTTPKNHKPREIPLAQSALDALKSYRHLKGELVFCGPTGKALTKGECKHPLWRACKAAKLRRVGWHVLRHTFASHLAMRGVPVRTIQELLGHATLTMTLRYAHLAPEVTRDAVAMLDRRADTGLTPNTKVMG